MLHMLHICLYGVNYQSIEKSILSEFEAYCNQTFEDDSLQ